MAHSGTLPVFNALDNPVQQHLYRVLHETANRRTTWTGTGGARHVLAIHQESTHVAVLWRESGAWYVGKQTVAQFIADPAGATTTAITTVPSTTAHYMPYEEKPHRIFAQGMGGSNPTYMVWMTEQTTVVNDTFSVYQGTATGGLTLLGSKVWTAPIPDWFSGSAELQDGDTVPFMVYPTQNGTTEGLIVVDHIGASPANPWGHWESTFYTGCPLVHLNVYGIHQVYFVAPSMHGKGRTLYKASYDARVTTWSSPEEIIVFDTTNSGNGIDFPSVSHIGPNRECLTYIRRMADSDSTNQRSFVVMRVKDKSDGVWGEEHYLASLDTIEGIEGRVLIEDPQYYSVVVDYTNGQFLVLTMQGYYKGYVGYEFGVLPHGVDITSKIEEMSLQFSEGLSAGTVNTAIAAREEDLVLTQGDRLHIQTGVVTTSGDVYYNIMSSVVDKPRYEFASGTWTVEGRTLHALGVSQGQQDTATRWFGTNHTVFVPKADDYERLITQATSTTNLTDASTATTADPVSLSTAFVAASGSYRAATALETLAIPPDKCTPVTVKRSTWFAQYAPAHDVTFEATFELKPQRSSIDPYPTIFVGANQAGTCFYGFGYKAKSRKLYRIIRKQLTTGVVDTETEITTLAVTPIRLTLELSRQGNILRFSYRINDADWNYDAHTYTDTTVTTGMVAYPSMKAVEGYCGIAAFQRTTGILSQTTVSVWVSRYRSVTHRPPLCLEHVLDDAMRICGYSAEFMGIGKRRPALPILEVGITENPASGGYSQFYDNGAVWELYDRKGMVRSPDKRVDTIAAIEPFQPARALTLMARFLSTNSWEPSSSVTPFAQGYTGTGIGVSLIAPSSDQATYLGISSENAVYVWIWYRDSGGTTSTIYLRPVPYGFIYADDQIIGGRYVFAVQNSFLGVWFGDIFLGGCDIGDTVLPFPLLREGSSIFMVDSSEGVDEPVFGELWMSVFNTPVIELTLGIAERAIDWVDSHIQTSSADVAFRGSIQGFVFGRSDLKRTVNHTIEDSVLDGAVETSGYEWVSHVRFVGKNGQYGDAYDMPRLLNRQHRFITINDEALETVEQCQQAAQRYMIKQNRTESQIESAVVYSPLVELLDILSIQLGPTNHQVMMTDFSLSRSSGSAFMSVSVGNRNAPHIEEE